MPCSICSECDGPYPGPPRSGITIQREDEPMRAEKRYYLNADRSKVVDEGDPEASYLLAAEGGEISNEDAKKYGLGRYAPEEESAPAEGKMIPAPPENKAVQMGDTVKSGREAKK